MTRALTLKIMQFHLKYNNNISPIGRSTDYNSNRYTNYRNRCQILYVAYTSCKLIMFGWSWKQKEI